MNLIICCTPLQVLIAEKIIELHPGEKFCGVIITPVYNEKYLFYHAKMDKICCKTYLICTRKYSRLFIYINIFVLKMLLWGKSFKKIFISNINDVIIQAIISKFSNSDLYTFDDGTINISPNNFGFSRNKGCFKRALRLLLGIYEDIDTIKERSKSHYTIYPNFPNIISNVINIKLINEECNLFYKDDAVRIMLGQSIFTDDDKNKSIIKKIIDEYKINLYFPHPLEGFYIDNVTYIDTPLIFEDYLINHLSCRKCIIYTFFSSAALNISNLNNVEVISFKVKELENPSWLEVYTLFEKSGIKVIDYEI